MKKLLTIIIASAVILYLLFAFAEWQFNPEYWEGETRQICTLLIAATTFVITIYIRKEDIEL